MVSDFMWSRRSEARVAYWYSVFGTRSQNKKGETACSERLALFRDFEELAHCTQTLTEMETGMFDF